MALTGGPHQSGFFGQSVHGPNDRHHPLLTHTPGAVRIHPPPPTLFITSFDASRSISSIDVIKFVRKVDPTSQIDLYTGHFYARDSHSEFFVPLSLPFRTSPAGFEPQERRSQVRTRTTPLKR